MLVSYRTNGTQGTIQLLKIDDLQIAFNRVAAKLQTDGWLKGVDIGKHVRIEGKVKIGKRNYPAIMQAGLIVVKDGPKIPDRVECRT